MKNIILSILVFCHLFVSAQSVEWITSPQYDYLEPIQYNLVKVKTNGKVGVITNKGRIVVEPVYDSITGFKEGKALIVDNRCKQLIGVIYGATKSMNKIDGYEIDTDFPYFSDGMLAVKNSDGKWGFLNANLDECAGYLSCKNESVLPFSDNKTFIKINSKEHAYFDTNGNPLIGNFGKIVDGYSFSNGVALVLLNNLSWAWIDTQGNVTRSIKAPKQKTLPTKNGKTIIHCGNVFNFDDQWCLISINIDNKQEEFEHIIGADSYTAPQTVMLSVNDDMLLYDGKELIPQRFDDIIILDGETVAVGRNGKYGILHIIPNQNFSAEQVTRDIVFYHASNEKVLYNISKPEHLQDKDIIIKLNDSNKNNVAFETVNRDNLIEISFYIEPKDDKLNRNSSEEYHVTVSCDNIKYKEESFTINKLQRKGFSISCTNNTISADSLGFANCDIIVRNNTKTKSKPTHISITYDENKETKVKVFNPGESIKIPVRINAVMSDDYINKDINISLYEDNYPAIHSKETLTIHRYIPEEINNY